MWSAFRATRSVFEVEGFLHLVGSILVSLHGLLHFLVSDLAEVSSVLEGQGNGLHGSEPSEVGMSGEFHGFSVEGVGDVFLLVENSDDLIGLTDISLLVGVGGLEGFDSFLKDLLSSRNSVLALSPPSRGLSEDTLSLGDSTISSFSDANGASEDLQLCISSALVLEVLHGFEVAFPEDGNVLPSSHQGLALPSFVMRR